MPEPDDALPPGHVRFLDSFQPGLKPGTYIITVQHTLAAPDADIPSVAQVFHVAGPRFVLNPADIHAEFPPNGASGPFEEVLPHIVLNKRLLPWERDIPGLGDLVPWVALLVFQEGELIPTDPDPVRSAVANYAQTMTVKDLLAIPSSQACVPTIEQTTLTAEQTTLTAEEKAMSCQVITISSDTFVQLVPTARELPYLAHAREVDTDSKILLDLQHAGLFSVVVANRFPLPGSPIRRRSSAGSRKTSPMRPTGRGGRPPRSRCGCRCARTREPVPPSSASPTATSRSAITPRAARTASPGIAGR
jgi:hypothetical protein